MENTHETVRVEFGEREVDIDVEIAPLITEIWKTGMLTVNSCQENKPGIAWIQFVMPAMANDFVNIVAGPYSEELDSLYNRARAAGGGNAGPVEVAGNMNTEPVEGAWEYDTYPFNLTTAASNGCVEEDPTGLLASNVLVSIRFPHADLPILLERLRTFNDQKHRNQPVAVNVLDGSSTNFLVISEQTGSLKAVDGKVVVVGL